MSGQGIVAKQGFSRATYAKRLLLTTGTERGGACSLVLSKDGGPWAHGYIAAGQKDGDPEIGTQNFSDTFRLGGVWVAWARVKHIL